VSQRAIAALRTRLQALPELGVDVGAHGGHVLGRLRHDVGLGAQTGSSLRHAYLLRSRG